ncbi:MAG: hypothetical protein WAM64_03605, partial [Acidimicrobiales bacterium]
MVQATAIDARGRLSAQVLAVTVLLLASLVVPSSVVAGSTSNRTSTYALYAGHGVGVIATENPFTGCGNVYLTNNFRRWRKITPAVKNPREFAKGLCAYTWSDAYFVSPTDGWLEATDGADVDTILRHTLNGGKTWIVEPGESTGSAGGGDTVRFVNGSLGWRQQFGWGSNGNYAIQRTLNGGLTWSTRSPDPRGSCIFANDVFSSSTTGFASVPWASATNPTNLWRTINGALNWSVLKFSPPPGLSSTALGLYGAPDFSGSYGVVPVDYSVAGHQDLFFYVSHDAGLVWQLDVASHLPVVIPTGVRINRQNAVGQSCSATSPLVSGRVPVVVSASPTTWWLVVPGPQHATELFVITAGGRDVTSFTVRDLPKTTSRLELAALNADDALLTLPIPSGYQTTYESLDGGIHWLRMSLS